MPDKLALLEILASQAVKVIPTAKRLYHEGQAAKGELKPDPSILRGKVSEVIGRITGIRQGAGWLQSLFAKIGHKIIVPAELFDRIAVQDWLNNDNVQEWFYEIVSLNLTDTQPNIDQLRNNLAQKYSEYTGERTEYALAAIDIAISTIVVSIISDFDSKSSAIATFVQEGNRQIRQDISKISQKIDSTKRFEGVEPFLRETQSKNCQQAIDNLLNRRLIQDERVLNEISDLASKLDSDPEFEFADPSVKARVLFYAALWSCDKLENLPIVDGYIERLRALDSKADIRRIEAAKLYRQGAADRSVEILDQVQNPEGQAQLFSYLRENKGPKAALEWLDTFTPYSFDLLAEWGWRNVAIAMAETSNWKEALDLIIEYRSQKQDASVSLAYLEAVLRIGLLIIKEFRINILEGTLVFEKEFLIKNTEEADNRQKALNSLIQVESVAKSYGVINLIKSAEYFKSWLLLTDSESYGEGVAFIKKQLESIDTALDYVDLALQLGIEFDITPIQRYLRQRELIGADTYREIKARLAILIKEDNPRKIINFMKDNKNQIINKVVPRTKWAGLLIENFVKVGEYFEAEKTLDEEKLFLEDDASRIGTMIAAARGDDIYDRLLENYKSSSKIIDLFNLCNYLDERKDFVKLRDYALEACRLQENIKNVFRAVRCLSALDQNEDIISLLHEYPHFVQQNRELKFAKAWALFYLGRLEESKIIADSLFSEQADERSSGLKLNIALFSGCWEEIGGIIQGELNRSQTHSADHLLQMAHLVSHIDSDLSLALLQKAVSVSAEDVKVLTNASILSVQLGRDEIGFSWFYKAANLSGPEGPIKAYKLPEIKEMLLEERERSESIQEKLRSGQIPWHIFCQFSRMPLSRPLVAMVKRNFDELDIRKKTLLPIRHGGKRELDLTDVHTIAIDITSLMLAECFGIFEKVFESFDTIFIGWETMSILMEEERSVRFHQPSLIREAKHLIDLIHQKKLAINPDVNAPTWLITEVGKENAVPLHLAKEKGGRFISAFPLVRAGTLLMDHADLKEYDEYVATLGQVLVIMRSNGHLSQSEFETAIEKLKSFGIEEPSAGEESELKPLFLDRIALEYLHKAGVLQKVCQVLECFISKEKYQDLLELSSLELMEGQILETLESLRRKLREGLESNKIICMPRFRDPEDRPGEFKGLSSLFSNLEPIDAVWIDDRAFGKHEHISDRSGHNARLVGLWSIVNELMVRGNIHNEKKYDLQYQMRLANLIMIPIDAAEVDHWLMKAKIDSSNEKIIEIAELRAIRQNYQRLISTTYIQLPDEEKYLRECKRVVIDLLRKYWSEDPLDLDKTKAISNWLIDSLYTSVVNVIHLLEHMEPETLQIIFIRELSQLVNADNNNRRYYLEWLNDKLLQPLITSNSEILRRYAELIKSTFRRVSDDFGSG